MHSYYKFFFKNYESSKVFYNSDVLWENENKDDNNILTNNEIIPERCTYNVD